MLPDEFLVDLLVGWIFGQDQMTELNKVSKPSWKGLVETVSFEGEDIAGVYRRAGEWLAEPSNAPMLNGKTRLQCLSGMPQQYLEQDGDTYRLILFCDVAG